MYNHNWKPSHNHLGLFAWKCDRCSDEVKRSWTEQLEKLGIDINSSNVTGGMKTAQNLEQRKQEIKS